jgi:hypothetical protein
MTPPRYLTAHTLAALAGDPRTRLTPCLVRCNGCRLTALANADGG